MKLKSENLSGAALDWAVAMVLRYNIRIHTRDDGFSKCIMTFFPLLGWEIFDPSTDWAIGGPLKEEYNIGSGPHNSFQSVAHIGPYMITDPWAHRYVGRTQLIAAMRCLVGTQLGEFIEIPEELCNSEI